MRTRLGTGIKVRGVVVGALVLGAAVVALSAAPARADDDERWEHRGWPSYDRDAIEDHEEAEEAREAWQRHEWLEHEEEERAFRPYGYSYEYVPPPVRYYRRAPRVYAPPPIIYGPPPGLNFGFMFGP